ncbi:MAG: tetratricopeptide repeat protein [Nitrospirota bacterium]
MADGGHPSAYYNFALALERAGRADDAIRAYEEFLARAPAALPFHRQRAEQRIMELRRR